MTTRPRIRKRRCKICGTLFMPDPRSKGRQAVCSQQACQKEAHRQRCKRWREQNPGYSRQIGKPNKWEKAAVNTQEGRQLLFDRVDWDEVRKVAGPDLGELLQELAREQKIISRRLEANRIDSR